MQEPKVRSGADAQTQEAYYGSEELVRPAEARAPAASSRRAGGGAFATWPSMPGRS